MAQEPQSVTGTSNDTGTSKGGASVGDSEKADWKADSAQSVVNKTENLTKLKKKSINFFVKVFH